MNLLKSIVTIIIVTEFVIGNFANVFVALVNFTDWIKRKRISTADRILTALAISRIGLLWSILISWHSSLFSPDRCSGIIKYSGCITWGISNHLSTWLATILSIFYLFKIANFSSLLFLHLKRRAENVLLGVFLATSLFIFSNFAVVTLSKTMWASEYEGNVTWNIKLKDFLRLSNTTLFSLINILPFIISLICSLLLIYSLCKHLRNMKLHGKGCQDPSATVHKKALLNVVSFVLLYATYSLSVILSSWSLNGSLSMPVGFFGMAIGTIYPSSHSCILIWGNQRMKQTLLRVLWQVRCSPKAWKPSSPRISKKDTVSLSQQE